MSEKRDEGTGERSNLIGSARPDRIGASESLTAPANGQETGNGAVVSNLRARSKSDFSGIFQRPANSGIFWVDYRDPDGKRRREKAGKFEAAADLLRRRKLEVSSGTFVRPRSALLTFAEMAEEAIRQKSLRLAELTVETDEYRLGHLLSLLGELRFDRITAAKVEETLAQLKRSGLSNSTVNRYRSFISTVFTYAIATNRISANPVTRVKRYKENEARVRWLRPEEEVRLRSCLKADFHQWEFDLALHTGMRRGEQFFLRWRDCDLERGILTVKGKTGRRHIIANETAISALKKLSRYTGENEFVSPNNDGSAKRDWNTWFEEAVKEANIQDFRWHDLRHTFASRLVMAGVDLKSVQELLGHKSIVMTMKYAHLSADHRKLAVEKLDAQEARL